MNAKKTIKKIIKKKTTLFFSKKFIRLNNSKNHLIGYVFLHMAKKLLLTDIEIDKFGKKNVELMISQ